MGDSGGNRPSSRPHRGKKLNKLKPLPPYVRVKVHPAPDGEVDKCNSAEAASDVSTAVAGTECSQVVEFQSPAAQNENITDESSDLFQAAGQDAAARSDSATEKRDTTQTAITVIHEAQADQDALSLRKDENLETQDNLQANGHAHDPGPDLRQEHALDVNPPKPVATVQPQGSANRLPQMLKKDMRGASATQLQDRCREILSDVAGPNPQSSFTSEESFEAAANQKATAWSRLNAFAQRLLFGFAHWILGYRNIDDMQDTNLPDIIRFKSRVEGIALYSAGAVAVGLAVLSCLLGSQQVPEAIVAASCVGFLVLSLIGLHMSNRFRFRDVKLALGVFVGVLVIFFLLSPMALHAALGGGQSSGGIALWSIFAPVSSLFLFHHNPLRICAVVIVSRILVVLALYAFEPELSGISEGLPWSMHVAIEIAGFILIPIGSAIAFRHRMREFYYWRVMLKSTSDSLRQKRDNTKGLLHSMLPEERAKLLVDTVPELWYNGDHDEFEECTVVQMDIKGFTALSAEIKAEELVALINAIFSSIDKAASFAGHMWKVETIGDCYKVLVGGPHQTPHHAKLAVVFSYLMIEIVDSISKRLALPLSCRCGVHTGKVTAAVVGSILPRYLIFGRSCEIVNVMEATADVNGVQVSEDTYRLLGNGWQFGPEVQRELVGGVVRAHMINLTTTNSAHAKAECFSVKVPELWQFVQHFLIPNDSAIENTQWNLGVDGLSSEEDSPELERNRSNGTRSPAPANTAMHPGSPEELREMISKIAVVNEHLQFNSIGRGAAEKEDSAHGKAAEEQAPAARSPARLDSPAASPWGSRIPSAADRLPFPGLASPKPHSTLQPEANGSAELPAAGRESLLDAEGLSAEPLHDTRTESRAMSDGDQLNSIGRLGSGSGVGGLSRSMSMGAAAFKHRSAGRTARASLPDAERELSSIKSNKGLRRFSMLRSPILPELTAAALGGHMPLGMEPAAWSPPPPAAPSSPAPPPPAPPPEPPEPLQVGEKTAVAEKKQLRDFRAKIRVIVALNSAATGGKDEDTIKSHTHTTAFGAASVVTKPPMGNGSPVRGSSPNVPPRNPSPQKTSAGTRPADAIGHGESFKASAQVVDLHQRASDGALAAGYRQNRRRNGVTPGRRGSMFSEGRRMSLEGAELLGLQSMLMENNSAAWESFQLDDNVAVSQDEDVSGAQLQGKIMRLLLSSACFCAAIQAAALLTTKEWLTDSSRCSWNGCANELTVEERAEAVSFAGLKSAVYAAVTLLSTMCSRWDLLPVKQGIIRRLVEIQLFVAPLVFTPVDGWQWSSGAMLWSSLAVLLSCSYHEDGKLVFLAWTLVYVVQVVVFGVFFHVSQDTEDTYSAVLGNWADRVYWVGNGLVPSTLCVLPLALSVRHLWRGWKVSKQVLDEVTSLLSVEEGLLRALVPDSIVTRLLHPPDNEDGMVMIADRYEDTAVMFVYLCQSDVQFSIGGPERASEDAKRALAWINEVYLALDRCVSSRPTPAGGAAPLTKVETFNNFYLAVAGLDLPGATREVSPTWDCVEAALHMARAVRRIMRPDGKPTEIKIGVNAGPLCAGVIGQESPRYSIFGDTVNTASRMASLGEVTVTGRVYIHLSAAAAVKMTEEEQLDMQGGHGVTLQELPHQINVKGKGKLQTWSIQSAAPVAAPPLARSVRIPRTMSSESVRSSGRGLPGMRVPSADFGSRGKPRSSSGASPMAVALG